MPHWIAVADVADFPLGSAREVVAEGKVIALFHTAEGFFALDGLCPHQGGPLGKGKLEGCVVTCPWHGFQFDVRTGQHQVSANLVHPRFPAKVEGEQVWVDISE